MCDRKSNEAADKWRNEGNLQFNKGKLLEALIAYNTSLCFALSGTPQVSLIFANRSAIYLKAKLYRRCLQNIELARKFGYPSDKLQKLDEREQKCVKWMENHQPHPERDPWNFFKLSFPPNEKIPFVANCLELREDEKYGRFIVTNTNLRPGDVIAIDEPVFRYRYKSLCAKLCAHCLKSNDLCLFPCPLCTTAMYCSEGCCDKHRKLIHQLECGRAEMHENKAIAASMILSALSTAGSVENLRRLLNESTCKTLFDFDWNNPQDSSWKKNVVMTVNALTTVRETEFTRTEPLSDLLDRPPFDSFIQTDEDREFIESFAHQQLRILDTNLYDLKQHSRLSEAFRLRGTFGQSIGSGLCMFASLFSHSCDPHVKRITVDNKIAFVVVRPVWAGKQVYISYGYSSYGMPRVDRQMYLKSYGFKCDCEACAHNYPMLVHQPRMVYSYKEPEHNLMTARDAIAEFKRTSKLVETIIDQHPCYETTDMIIYSDHLLHQIAKHFLEE